MERLLRPDPLPRPLSHGERGEQRRSFSRKAFSLEPLSPWSEPGLFVGCLWQLLAADSPASPSEAKAKGLGRGSGGPQASVHSAPSLGL